MLFLGPAPVGADARLRLHGRLDAAWSSEGHRPTTGAGELRHRQVGAGADESGPRRTQLRRADGSGRAASRRVPARRRWGWASSTAWPTIRAGRRPPGSPKTCIAGLFGWVGDDRPVDRPFVLGAQLPQSSRRLWGPRPTRLLRSASAAISAPPSSVGRAAVPGWRLGQGRLASGCSIMARFRLVVGVATSNAAGPAERAPVGRVDECGDEYRLAGAGR